MIDPKKFSFSWSEIQFVNVNGMLDHWLEQDFQRAKIVIKLGESDWGIDEFQQIFSGIADDSGLESSGRNILTLGFADNTLGLKKALLNTLDSGEKRPLVLGSAFNISPLLIDESIHLYELSDCSLSVISEVRDNGVPISFTATGSRINLTQQPVGEITADCENIDITAEKMIRYLIIERAGYSEADINQDDLTQLALDCSQHLGFWGDNYSTIRQAIVAVLSSVGAIMWTDYTGQFRFKKIVIPTQSTPVEQIVNDWAIVSNTTKIEEQHRAITTYRLKYSQNNTVQSSVAGSIEVNTGLAQRYNQDWLVEEIVTPSQSGYEQQLEQETLLINQSDAQAMAVERAGLLSKKMTTYAISGTKHGLLFSIADPVIFESNQFGLKSKLILLTGISFSPNKKQVFLSGLYSG